MATKKAAAKPRPVPVRAKVDELGQHIAHLAAVVADKGAREYAAQAAPKPPIVRFVVEIGDANHNNKADVMARLEIAGRVTTQAGPFDVPAAEAAGKVIEAFNNLRSRLGGSKE